MRIDAHQHFWVYNPQVYAWIDESMAKLRRDFLPADLKPELDRAGFQGGVAVQARQSLEETNWLLKLATESPLILGVVGWFDLRSPQLRSELEALAPHPKLVGVRYIVQSEPDDNFLLRPEFLRGVSMLEEFDLAYDILIYDKQLPAAAKFVRRFPRQRFVLDHLAKPPIRSQKLHPWTQGIQNLTAHPNVSCKLSGLVAEAHWHNWKPDALEPYLDVALESFGPDRLMIGSDWPVCTVAASCSTAVDAVKQFLDLRTGKVRERVLGSNAQQFYKPKLPAPLR